MYDSNQTIMLSNYDSIEGVKGFCTCSIGVETFFTGFTGRRVGEEETRVTWRTDLLLP